MKTVDIIYRYWSPGAPTRPRPQDAQAALLRLSDGNNSFATLLDRLGEGADPVERVIDVDPRDLGLLLGEHVAPAQHPFAVVLGCSDARVPIELIFNEGPNDLFVIRVAGNGLGHDVLGSLWYALEHLRESLRLVVVLGHSGCGAVSAAVDAFLHPLGYLLVATTFSLRGILDRLLIVVDAAARKLAATYGSGVAEQPGYREALIAAAVAGNAAQVAFTVQQELTGLGRDELRVVYGVYRLETREMWVPPGTADAALRLAHPPSDLAAFEGLTDAIAKSELVAPLLTAPIERR
jgi:carbonic anhydrase